MSDSEYMSELTASSDAELIASVRRGDRHAFGLLYLMHHEAAWRVACSVTGFTDGAEVAVIEGFTAVFDAIPDFPADLRSDICFRAYLFVSVRESALDRRARRRGARAVPADEIHLDDDLDLSAVEHELVRGALCQVSETSRTAFWLTDVEAMTPQEVATVLGTATADVAALAAEARGAVRLACPDAQTPASLSAAVPVAPLLSGECQRHWHQSTRPITGARPA